MVVKIQVFSYLDYIMSLLFFIFSVNEQLL